MSAKSQLRRASGRKASGSKSSRAVGAAGEAGDSPRSLPHRLAVATLWLLFLVLPIVLDSAQKDAFRLVKSLAAETLALVTLFFLSFGWKGPREWQSLLRAPFATAFGPFVIGATLLSLASPHVAHVHRGLVGLWVGALAIWGWSVGFERRELRRALTFLLVPASILAAIAILQFHGLYQPYGLAGIAASSRYANGSLAGNVGDLAACLVLPVLLAQAEIARALRDESRRRARRLGLAVTALVLSLYAVAVTQTIAAVAAVVAGSIVYWSFRLPRRRALTGGAVLVGGALLLLAVVAPLRERAVGKVGQIARGDWNSVLTGRLDGWRAATWMLGEHPLTGVGVGAFRTEFIDAKTALVRSGVQFFEEQQNVVFANAHNEILEVGAETGWPGLALFLFGLWLLVRRLRSARFSAHADAEPGDSAAALAWAGCVSIAVVSLANFPFRIAIALWPIALFLAWIFATDGESSPAGAEEGAG